MCQLSKIAVSLFFPHDKFIDARKRHRLDHDVVFESGQVLELVEKCLDEGVVVLDHHACPARGEVPETVWHPRALVVGVDGDFHEVAVLDLGSPARGQLQYDALAGE